jgi:hypothetical protein
MKRKREVMHGGAGHVTRRGGVARADRFFIALQGIAERGKVDLCDSTPAEERRSNPEHGPDDQKGQQLENPPHVTP